MAINGKSDGNSIKKVDKFTSDMIKGYRKMAKINIKLSEESRCACNDALDAGLEFLSECENGDNKTRRHILC